jgi:hypothetical protein
MVKIFSVIFRLDLKGSNSFFPTIQRQWSWNGAPTPGPHTVHNSVNNLPKFSFRQDNPPLRSGIPERKMKGAANFTLDMVRVVGGKDYLRMEGNLRDFHRIF